MDLQQWLKFKNINEKVFFFIQENYLLKLITKSDINKILLNFKLLDKEDFLKSIVSEIN